MTEQKSELARLLEIFAMVPIDVAPGPEYWQCGWCGATNSGLSPQCWKCGASKG